MATFRDRNSTQAWETVSNGITRKGSVQGLMYVSNEYTGNLVYNYNQNKNYQIITGVTGSNSISAALSLKFSSPFKNSVIAKTRELNTNCVDFYTYINTLTTESSKNIVTYGATAGFASSVISYSNLNEIDFLINGYSEFRYLDRPINDPTQPSGWTCDNTSSYNWHSSTTSLSPTFSKFGSGTNTIFGTNYIATIVNYDIFNLEFNYNKIRGGVNDLLSVYSATSLKGTWTKIKSYSQSVTASEFSISGIDSLGNKKYLIFSASESNTDFYASLTDINIYGGYHDDNNSLLYLTMLGNTTSIQTISPNPTFSFISISNGFTSSITSKFGNGAFKKGVWENGVWNNGWREDTNSRDFLDIYQYIQTYSDITWRVKIYGSTQSTSFFKVGDKVAIGNIVGIDINDNRKLLKDYYRVIGATYSNDSQNKDQKLNWIEVEINTTFPYRRIERDSDNHKIKVTKNIWLSGAFFNGYFTGVWNNGLFRGYPFITQMNDTHWVDGIYNGGRFGSSYKTFDIVGVKVEDSCKTGYIVITFNNYHNFSIGDYMILSFYSSIDPGLLVYNGLTIVKDVIDDKNIVVDKLYTGANNQYISGSMIIGVATRYTASGLIQNFKFYDNNISKIKSSTTTLSSSVFSFNSWIDVNYDETRAVTIGKLFKSYDAISKKSVSRNNIYGYPTYDILSSDSYFRDSFTLDTNTYKLGTKYKMYNDFIGDYSNFNDPFDNNNFNVAGWTYSYNKEIDMKVLRTDSIISLNVYDLETTQAFIDSGVTGDELYTLSTSTGILLNNENITMQNDRYSVVEFDVITHSNSSDYYTHRNSDYYTIDSISSNGISTISTSPNEITSVYNISSTVQISDIFEIEVGIDLIGDLTGIVINLVSSTGFTLNLKKKGIGSGIGFRLVDTLFNTNIAYKTVGDSISPYSVSVATPPYSGKYGMDKLIGQGTSYVSNTSNFIDLLGTDISGDWTLYIWDDKDTAVLEKWSLKFYYRNTIAINNRPDIDIPILNLSNLNYDISTQIVGTGNEQVYDKLSYLPITENIDHLVTTNTFRLDTIEDTSPENWNKRNSNKKYEYFYNKTDLMMNISGNGFMGAASSMIVLDNIKLYEVDMIPFFRYFSKTLNNSIPVNIYKGIQIPINAIAPSIDYTKSDFVFLDNINISIDTIENRIVSNSIICDIFINSIIPPSGLSYITPNTFIVGQSVSLSPQYDGSTGTFSHNIPLPLGLSLNSIGIIFGTVTTVTPETTYTITLQNDAGITSFDIRITVNEAPILPDNIIVANDDYYSVYNNVTSDTNSVLTGDTLNGTQVLLFGGPYGVVLQQLSTTNISINIKPSGRINIPSGTLVGTYTLRYEICEITNPTNCASASVLVSVSSELLPLLSFYFEGNWANSDTLHDPEVNSWVDYLDEYGELNRVIIGGIENGCQVVYASEIVDYNGCDYCTPGGGGGTCLVEGTLITLIDGTQTTIESLFINQQLLSSRIETLDDTNDLEELYKWSSNNLIEDRIESFIVKVNPLKVYKTIIINNGLLEATPTHVQLIERNNRWRFVTFGDILIGDKLYCIDKEIIEIVSIEINTDERIVYSMLLSNISHTYFSNNILTHNKRIEPDII